MPRSFKTPRKSGGGFAARGARTTPGSGTDRLNGHFSDGGWACNCDPRQPALLLQVKKNNGNKGRWFYTCPAQRKQQCDFFLWKEDAETRERGAVLSNTDTHVSYEIGTPSSAQENTPSRHPASSRVETNPVRRRLFPPQTSRQAEADNTLRAATRTDGPAANDPVKRKRVAFADDEDGNGSTTEREDFDDGDDWDSEEEQQLIQLADGTGESNQRRGQMLSLREYFQTPTSRHSHDVLGGMPTPVSHSKSEAEQPQAKRPKTDHGVPQPPSSAPEQPPTSSFTSALSDDTATLTSTPTRGGQGQRHPQIVEEIMGLIPAGAVTEAIRQQIQDGLDLYVRRAQGMERGRDVAREEMKKKAAETQALQIRMAELESEGRKDKETISRLKKAVTALSGTD